MTLDNLVGMSLEIIAPDPLTIRRLLEAAQRNLQDAKLIQLSNENRFDVAYKSIMQMANAVLQSRGYRTLTSKSGHHQTMIQTLPKTLNISHTQIIVLDALRKQRNVADYSGDLVTDAAVNECIIQAEALWKIIETKTSLLIEK
ncbi:hypothetical protein [Cellvibrio sp. UBA7661]|uniref:hypothetical protein n=1 Tax=Cellvibrio sp. UBA7661 TaxID=1946311 RepID=UPI002F355F65